MANAVWGPLEFKEISSTPSTPTSGTQKIYAKTDNKFYLLISSGNEYELINDNIFFATAGENLTAGNLVYIDGGTQKVYKANNTLFSTLAKGFVKSNFSINTLAKVYVTGENTSISGYTPNELLYLGTNGGVTYSSSIPAAESGEFIQIIGFIQPNGKLYVDIEKRILQR